MEVCGFGTKLTDNHKKGRLEWETKCYFNYRLNRCASSSAVRNDSAHSDQVDVLNVGQTRESNRATSLPESKEVVLCCGVPFCHLELKIFLVSKQRWTPRGLNDTGSVLAVTF